MTVNALLSFFSASDLKMWARVHDWTPPRWLCAWMLVATRFGDGWGWLALVPLLAACGRRGQDALVAGVAGGVSSVILFSVLKRRFRRPRPCERAPHPRFHVPPPDAFSFPSGHAMSACAIATALGLHAPVWAPLLAFVAVSVGISRVVLGLHYVTDVLAGGVLGCILGLAAATLLVG
jgi:undecaprenyl-diphosphatase